MPTSGGAGSAGVVTLLGDGRYRPDASWLAGRVVVATRDWLGLGPDQFAEGLRDILGWLPSAGAVEAWESGTAPPPGDVIVACSLLGPQEFRLLLRQGGTLEDVDRRQFLTGLAGLVASSEVESWERLNFALKHPGRLDQATVDQLEGVTIALARLEPQAEPSALLGAVTGHLDALASMLSSSLRPSMRTQVCSIAGETAGVAGRLQWMLDDDGRALAYYRVGLEAAREAGDAALGAYLMGKAACKPYYRENADERLKGLAGSFGFTTGDAVATTGAWLSMLEAEAHALKHDRDAALRCMDHATGLLGCPPVDESPRPRVSFFNDAWLAGQRGACFVSLGSPDEARPQLTEALDALGSTLTKQRTWLLAMMATSYVLQGEPDEASRVGQEALACARALGATADLGLVRGLLRDLAPWRECPAVEQLAEQLAAGIP